MSLGVGVLYLLFIRQSAISATVTGDGTAKSARVPSLDKSTPLRLFAIILLTAALGGLVFQSTTFALPKILEERLTDIAGTATLVGWYAIVVFSIAAFAQLVVGHLLDNHSVRTVFATVALLQAIFFFTMTQLEAVAALLVAVAFMLGEAATGLSQR